MHCWQLNDRSVLLGKLLLLESEEVRVKEEAVRESDGEELPKLLRKGKDEDGSSMPVTVSVESL